MGELLIVLPMFADYYEKEIPDMCHELGWNNIGFLLDGKYALMHANRNNDELHGSGCSAKIYVMAWRLIIAHVCFRLIDI